MGQRSMMRVCLFIYVSCIERECIGRPGIDIDSISREYVYTHI